MHESQNEELAERLYEEDQNGINNISSINNIYSTETITIDALNINSHYLCPNCHHFPLITFKENKSLILKCEDCNGIEITLDEYKKSKITKDNIQNFDKCDLDSKYIGYCFECKKFFSEKNSNVHIEHNFKNFKDIIKFIRNKLKIPEIEKVEPKSEFSQFTEKTDELGDSFEFKGNKFQKKEDNIENQFSDDPFEELIKMIINDESLYPNNTHYKNIKNIFYYLSDKFEIEYVCDENKSLKVNIFGHNFVENNINKFIILREGKVEKLKEVIKVKDLNEPLKIKLIRINEVADLSEMFYECDCLSKINMSNEWNTSDLEAINGMFCGCKLLENVPDISKWVTNKITDLNRMFERCESLVKLPDISKWKVENVKSMKDMFNGCESLESLPDLSKWKTNKLETISSMFENCRNLKDLIGIEKWNTSQIINMSYAFKNCSSLIKLEDISGWDTSKVTSFSNMFDNCVNLESLPDLSKWNTKNSKEMNFMFSNCQSLKYIPDISKWDVQNVLSMNSMFENCSSLESFPDISKWKINKKLDTNLMFGGCDSLKEKPKLNN